MKMNMVMSVNESFILKESSVNNEGSSESLQVEPDILYEFKKDAQSNG